ncbi:MAG: BON domain-containing protein [Magnetococcales bacterium]|nr:BON domain-containing protein [Magnetococcales bacterium]
MKSRPFNTFGIPLAIPVILLIGGCSLPWPFASSPDPLAGAPSGQTENVTDSAHPKPARPSENSSNSRNIDIFGSGSGNRGRVGETDAGVGFIQDDRPLRDRLADIQMEDAIQHFFQERVTKPDQFVHADVWEGRVLLTGNLDDPPPGFQKEVRRFLRAHPHIRILYDHTSPNSVVDYTSPESASARHAPSSDPRPLPQGASARNPPAPGPKPLPQSASARNSPASGPKPLPMGKLPDLANGTDATPADLTGIEERLALTRGIRPANYRWRIQGGTVFILGRAVNQVERDRVVSLFQSAPGVVKIVDYIQIKGD